MSVSSRASALARKANATPAAAKPGRSARAKEATPQEQHAPQGKPAGSHRPQASRRSKEHLATQLVAVGPADAHAVDRDSVDRDLSASVPAERAPVGKRASAERRTARPSRKKRRARLEFQVEPGSAGDHPGVLQLLSAVFQEPSRDGFQEALDEPGYEPQQRLLARAGLLVAGHVTRVRRDVHWGSLVVPTARLGWLGVLPEFRGAGLGRQLAVAAVDAARREGALVGWLRTRIPHFFRPQGWAVCGRYQRGRAGTRDLLAQLSAHGFRPGEGPFNIRPWRHVELPALVRLYRDNVRGSFGGTVRSEDTWRWIASRRDAGRIFVALEGPERFDLGCADQPIVGYCVLRDDCVVEMMAAADRPRVAEYLLVRACGEAIERDQHSLEHCGQPGDRLLEYFRIAGGSLSQAEAHQGEVSMAKLLDPAAWFALHARELETRAREAGLPELCELGLQVEKEKFRLTVGRGRAVWTADKPGRSYLRMNEADFTRLALGHLDLDEAIAQGRLEASTRLAFEMTRALFPRIPLWSLPLDDLLLGPEG